MLRFQRVDTDLSDLSDDEIGRLTQVLRRTDAVGAVDELDQQTLRALLNSEASASTRARTLEALDEVENADATRALLKETDGEATGVIGATDSDNLDALLSSCTISYRTSSLPTGITPTNDRAEATTVVSAGSGFGTAGQAVGGEVPRNGILPASGDRCPGYRLLKNAADPDIPDSELDLLLDPLSDGQIKTLARGLAGKENPGEFLDEISPETVRRITDAETPTSENSFAVAYDIYDEGYSERSIRRLADEDLTTRQTQRTLARLKAYKDNYETSDADDIAEIYGEVKLESELGDEYDVVSQVDIDYADTSRDTEVDQLILKDNTVVGAGQTKNSGTDEALSDAREQHRDFKDDLRQFGVADISRPGGDGNFEPEITSKTINDEQLYTIGPTEEYDIRTVQPEKMKTIYQVFDSRFQG